VSVHASYDVHSTYEDSGQEIDYKPSTRAIPPLARGQLVVTDPTVTVVSGGSLT